MKSIDFDKFILVTASEDLDCNFLAKRLLLVAEEVLRTSKRNDIGNYAFDVKNDQRQILIPHLGFSDEMEIAINKEILKIESELEV
ncbi:hypothetical protein OAQ99_04710 [Candidatus Kapabacteria bacterium]|nr:hypothetical protein [Candidatus Kapabacteria bacterium]